MIRPRGGCQRGRGFTAAVFRLLTCNVAEKRVALLRVQEFMRVHTTTPFYTWDPAFTKNVGDYAEVAREA